MKEILDPIKPEILKEELKQAQFLRKTSVGYKELYIFDKNDSEILLQEVGRLRELAFRYSGGGTGKECDIDKFDTGDDPYKQLIVWDPVENEILGGYRYLLGIQANGDGNSISRHATARLFNFSDNYLKDYLHCTLELGRSFVRMGEGLRKSMFALDNLWDGLGSLTNLYPQVKFFMGKVTMYSSFNKRARDLILYFLEKHHREEDELLTPIVPISYYSNYEDLSKVFIGETQKEDYKILLALVREYNESMPPLLNSYINVSPTMKYFGTSINEAFGNVEESAIMVTIGDIYDNKRKRWIKNSD
jgi:hypothetical protein